MDQTDSTVRLVVAEIIRFKEEFELIRNDSLIKTDLASFWLRKTKKPVLAVLLVQKPGGRPKLYRGTNMEVSMPTGSLCAERNVIGSALADDLTLKREDLKVIAVYSVRALDDVSNEKKRIDENKKSEPESYLSGYLPLNVDGSDGEPGSGSQTVDSSPCNSRNISRSNSYSQHHDIKYLNNVVHSDFNDQNGSSKAGCKRQKGDITGANTFHNSDHIVYHSDNNQNPSDICSVDLRSRSNSLCQDEQVHPSFYTAQTTNNVDHSTDFFMGLPSSSAAAATTTTTTTTTSATTITTITAGAVDASVALQRHEILLSNRLHDPPEFKLPSPAISTELEGTSLVPADARRSITAGKRSYSVDSVWILKSSVGRDVDGPTPALGPTGSHLHIKSGPSSTSNLLTAESFDNNQGERKERSSQVRNMNPLVSRSPFGKRRAIMDIPITWPHRTGSGIVESVKTPMRMNETKIENQANNVYHHRNHGMYAEKCRNDFSVWIRFIDEFFFRIKFTCILLHKNVILIVITFTVIFKSDLTQK